MSRSGWCAQRGRPNHEGCRVSDCSCECHRAVDDGLPTAVSAAYKGVTRGKIGPQVKSGPNRRVGAHRPGPDPCPDTAERRLTAS